MINRRFMGAFFVFCLVLTPWLAFGQGTPIPSSAEPTPSITDTKDSSTDSVLQFFSSATRQAKEWTASESSVQQELQRGLVRLEKGCSQKSPSPRSEPAAAQLALRLASLQDALTQRESRRDAFERRADQWATQAAELVARRCAGVPAVLGLGIFKTTACRRVEAIEQGVKGMRSELTRYLQATVERHRIYLRLAQLEQQACTRPGFTDRLLQADEVHLRPAELRQVELLEPWSRELRELLRSVGEQP